MQNRPLEAAWPGGFDVAQGAGTTTFTVSQLVDGTIYEFQVRACNAAGCGAWTKLLHSDGEIVAGHKVGNASLIPASASLAVGGRLGVGIHDIPKGKVAYAQMYGAIQPAGRCSTTRGTRDVARAPSASTGSGYYDTVHIEGCAPGGIGWLRVVNAAETELYARATIRVGVPPGKVGTLTVTPGNASLQVAWVAPSAGDRPITHYDLQYRAGTSGDWTLVEDITLTSYTVTGLTNGTSYQVQVRAVSEVGGGAWSDTATGTPSAGAVTQPDPGTTPDPMTPVVDIPDCGSVATRDHTAPTGLNVIPLSGHQVRLTWTGSTDSTGGYTVEFNPHGANWPEKVPDSNKKSVVQKVTSTGPIKTCLDFSLDSMISRAPQDGDGLADHAAYDIRVRASKTVSEQLVEYVSETITIIDTPITDANGHSPEAEIGPNPGQAQVRWTSVRDVLDDARYANGKYILRRRRVADDRASDGWRPNVFHATDFGDTEETSDTEQPMYGLVRDKIYALQLIYLSDDDDQTNDTKVFAARNSYVHPSAGPILVPGSRSGTKFAGFPVYSPMASSTYDYFICTDTFSGNRTRLKAWVGYIKHAFSQWDLATNNVVNTVYRGESCTDYSSLVREAQVEVLAALTDHSLITEDVASDREKIVKALESLIQHRWYLDVASTLADDSDANEIMMFDDYQAYPQGGPLYFAFTEAMSKAPVDPNVPNGEEIGEFGNRLGFVASTNCWGPSVSENKGAVACAYPSKRASAAGWTTDIFLLRTQVDHDPLVILGGDDISFNKCPDIPDYFVWLPRDDQDNMGMSVYGTLIHEAGHALGIDHPIGNVSSADTVMTTGVSYSCSPHPLDVLTVYALHRLR